MDFNVIEKCGPAFQENKILEARSKTWQTIQILSEKILPGMKESDAQGLIRNYFKEKGVVRQWHQPHIRFGSNTLKGYDEKSDPDIILKEEDIYFFDIGPVWDGYEGDAGRTFVVGKNSEMRRCAHDVETVFEEVKDRWIKSGDNGVKLYRYAEELTGSMGWVLCLRTGSGHRLSDFPHALYHKGSLANYEGNVSECRWVLEIQIRHPELPFGAFFEDLLK
jgi:Xaa-Pro aminopeptidase